MLNTTFSFYLENDSSGGFSHSAVVSASELGSIPVHEHNFFIIVPTIIHLADQEVCAHAQFKVFNVNLTITILS